MDAIFKFCAESCVVLAWLCLWGCLRGKKGKKGARFDKSKRKVWIGIKGTWKANKAWVNEKHVTQDKSS